MRGNISRLLCDTGHSLSLCRETLRPSSKQTAAASMGAARNQPAAVRNELESGPVGRCSAGPRLAANELMAVSFRAGMVTFWLLSTQRFREVRKRRQEQQSEGV